MFSAASLTSIISDRLYVLSSYVALVHRTGSSSRPVSTQSILGEDSRSVSASPVGLYAGSHLQPPPSSSSTPTSISKAAPIVFASGATSTGSGKPHNIRRGPGRPRKEFILKSQKQAAAPRDNRGVKRVRGGGALRGMYTKRKQQSTWTGNMPQAATVGQLPANNASNDANFTSPSSNMMMMPSPLNEDGSNSLTPTSSIDQDMLNATFQQQNVSSSEKIMQPPDELPYFPEKWPGKVCALCCLGERTQLGQGEMLRIEAKESDAKTTSMNASLESSQTSLGEDKSPRSLVAPVLSNRRQKGLNKCKNPVMTTEYVDELEKIGHAEAIEYSLLLDNGFLYIHRTCATWSMGIVRDISSGSLGNVDEVVSQSLARKCSFCNRFGAHMACKMSCPKYFHLPCVAASGGFQIIQNYTAFCKEHLGQVPLVCTEDINCRICSGLGDVANLMICSLCGDHYHGTCIGVAQLPGVRAGWQCSSCRRCQICRVPDAKQADGRSLLCEQCDKMYHANCLRPVMTSIPKYGWKCRVSVRRQVEIVAG